MAYLVSNSSEKFDKNKKSGQVFGVEIKEKLYFFGIENSKKYDNIKLNEKSIEILELIKDNGILNIDEICDNTKMEVKYINAILNELVLKDLLIEMNNQVYSLNI